jgi:hypothetical protein
MPAKKDNVQVQPSGELDDYLSLAPPDIPNVLDNVVLVFSNNIPEDAKEKCKLNNGDQCPKNEPAKRQHLLKFVRERLEIISRLEYTLWLNGRLPFITPRELLIWRLRQYVEHVWAFQLPDDDDLAMIFNTTKRKSAQVTSDFSARFRKALLFPIALRRLYRILREEDPVYRVVNREYPYKNADGYAILIPSIRYVQDTNALIEEYRLRDEGPLKDAAILSREETTMWVSEGVIAAAHDDKLKEEILSLYQIPRLGGYEG